jgi:ferric-dicitrate binding protein FerR (iron transport regulator)
MEEMYQDIDFEIIWKKIHGQTTDDEEILLSQWLNKSTSHRKYYENALRYYSSGTQFTNTAAELQKALKKINRKAGIHNSYRNTQIIAITSVAASILFFIYFQFFKPEINPNPTLTVHNAQSIVPGSNKAVLILADGSEHDLSSGDKSIIAADGTEIKNTGNKLEYISSNSQPAEMKYNTLKIPRGGEYFLILSDSTKVWLNSETTLRFPVQFAAGVRAVELNGEAYFEVSKNEKVPFIVTSGNQQVKVLGTQFNISSYVDNQSVYTTLVEGKVEVSLTTNPDSKLVLRPNEQSCFSKEEANILKRTVDVAQYIAWKDGRFVFQDQMLEDIMKTLSKWYDVQVVFANEDVKKLRFTGNLERYADFSNILGKIERTNEVEFEITNKLITIK